MNWGYDLLWNKAKLYVARSLDEQREGPMFPFWSILALELLARATLAKVHPTLLADPVESGENIFYALGYGATKSPKSIPSKTVFDRCQRVVPNFTAKEFGLCMTWVNLRNEELHTGAASFENWHTGQWLADFYRVCSLLLASQNKTLEDLFGGDEAAVAKEMIESLQREEKNVALDAVSAARKAFEKLDEDKKADLRAASEAWARQVKSSFKRITPCPACGSKGVLLGKSAKSGEPKLIDMNLVQEIVVIPTSFKCNACGLHLEGHHLLHPAELGGQFVVEEYRDPVDYLNIDVSEYFDPADYYQEEYSND